MNSSQLNILFVLISFLILVCISTTNDQEVRRISNKLTTGWINTLLIMLILLLSMTENL